jgi:NhaP-type Na+/H+ or K+/H+ antiporter
LILLPVFSGVPGSDRLLAICSLVVLVSVVLHGGSPMLLARAARKKALREVSYRESSTRVESDPPEQETSLNYPASTPEPITACAVSPESKSCAVDSEALVPSQTGQTTTAVLVGTESISIDELRQLWEANELVTILDVRTERSIEDSHTQAKGTVRMPPDHVGERAKELGLKQSAWLVAYCA